MIPILDFQRLTPAEMMNRDIQAEADVSAAVDAILEDVRQNGDQALRRYTRQLDGVELESLQVTAEELSAARAALDPDFLRTLELASENIRRFHQAQVHRDFTLTDRPGILMGQRYTPIQRVGVCVPRSPAAFPSTILMNVIPARIAGVREIFLVTPPEPDGSVSPAALAAAAIAGADRIFKVGGAQAVAALAYGTETIPPVDKIVGPGGIFVATAKRKVFGRVAIDMIAGPSEILVVADDTCNAKIVAADMLSQAEHDKMASAVLVTDSGELAKAVQAELERQIPLLPRSEIARASIDNNGKIIVAETLDAAIDIANEIAPEHLELCVDAPFDYLDRVRCAGSIFLGKNCPEALGDYFAGPNHTLPTSGTAKFSSALSVDDFVVKSQFTYYTADALAKIGEQVAYFARKEGLDAHANSVTVRLEEKKQ